MAEAGKKPRRQLQRGVAAAQDDAARVAANATKQSATSQKGSTVRTRRDQRIEEYPAVRATPWIKEGFAIHKTAHGPPSPWLPSRPTSSASSGGSRRSLQVAAQTDSQRAGESTRPSLVRPRSDSHGSLRDR